MRKIAFGTNVKGAGMGKKALVVTGILLAVAAAVGGCIKIASDKGYVS